MQKLYAAARQGQAAAAADAPGDEPDEDEGLRVEFSRRGVGEPATVRAASEAGALLLLADPTKESVAMPAFWAEVESAAAEDETISWALALDYEGCVWVRA